MKHFARARCGVVDQSELYRRHMASSDGGGTSRQRLRLPQSQRDGCVASLAFLRCGLDETPRGPQANEVADRSNEVCTRTSGPGEWDCARGRGGRSGSKADASPEGELIRSPAEVDSWDLNATVFQVQDHLWAQPLVVLSTSRLEKVGVIGLGSYSRAHAALARIAASRSYSQRRLHPLGDGA